MSVKYIMAVRERRGGGKEVSALVFKRHLCLHPPFFGRVPFVGVTTVTPHKFVTNEAGGGGLFSRSRCRPAVGWWGGSQKRRLGCHISAPELYRCVWGGLTERSLRGISHSFTRPNPRSISPLSGWGSVEGRLGWRGQELGFVCHPPPAGRCTGGWTD